MSDNDISLITACTNNVYEMFLYFNFIFIAGVKAQITKNGKSKPITSVL